MASTTMTFSKWAGDDGFAKFVFEKTGCKAFSGAGINYRSEKSTSLLRSVDGTYYYDDNLEDVTNVEYTLFGHNGDQNEKEARFNEPLLNTNKTKHVYLYRVTMKDMKRVWVWYGKYAIVGKFVKEHEGKDYMMRNIVVLKLQRIAF